MRLKPGLVKSYGGNVLEYAGLLLIEMEHGDRRKVRGKHRAARGALKELDHAVRIRIGKRLEQHSVDYGKMAAWPRCRAPGAADGCQGEKPGLFLQHPECVLNILPEIAHSSAPWRLSFIAVLTRSVL